MIEKSIENSSSTGKSAPQKIKEAFYLAKFFTKLSIENCWYVWKIPYLILPKILSKLLLIKM